MVTTLWLKQPTCFYIEDWEVICTKCQHLSSLSVSPIHTSFSRHWYLQAFQRNKHRPWTVATQKQKSSSCGVWSRKYSMLQFSEVHWGFSQVIITNNDIWCNLELPKTWSKQHDHEWQWLWFHNYCWCVWLSNEYINALVATDFVENEIITTMAIGRIHKT